MDYGAFAKISTTVFADLVDRAQVMDFRMRPLWSGGPRLAGPAYPVSCPPGDNLMFHASIYRAALGSVIVVEGGDCDFAIAGGNVCLAAQRFGVSGLIIDGVIRDAEEVREALFPVYARGLMPKPGVKKSLGTLATPVTCGGVQIALGDVVVADEEGIVILPAADAPALLERAVQADRDERAMTLDDWIDEHRTRIAGLLKEYGYREDEN